MDFIEPYRTTVLVMGLTGLMLFIQLLVADVIGLKAGKTPGYSVDADHNSLIFRASRAFSNTNESVSIFILFACFALFSSANPDWLNTSALIYLSGRIAHSAFYYTNIQLCRSIAFGISLIGLVGMFVAGLLQWL